MVYVHCAMGITDLFKKGPLDEAKIDKIAKLAANPYAQPDVRMKEMNKLLNEGTPAALRGVLKRFAANAEGHIADEDEKKWLEDQLVEIGTDALEPLADYVRTEDKLTYALRAYSRIAGDANAVGFFVDALNHYGPDDYRSADAKVQILRQLADKISDERVLPALMPFLADHSDEVRWAVLDILTKAADEKLLTSELQAAAAEHLGRQVVIDDNRPRLQRRAAEILCEREWAIKGDVEMVIPILEEDFFIDKKRFVRRRLKKRPEAK